MNTSSQQRSRSITGDGIGKQDMVDQQLATGLASTSLGALVGGGGSVLTGGGSHSVALLPSQAKVREGPKKWVGWAELKDGEERPKALYDDGREEIINISDDDVKNVADAVKKRKRPNHRGKGIKSTANSIPGEAGQHIPAAKVEGPGSDNLGPMSSSGGGAKAASESAKRAAQMAPVQASNKIPGRINFTFKTNLKTASSSYKMAAMSKFAAPASEFNEAFNTIASLTPKEKVLAEKLLSRKRIDKAKDELRRATGRTLTSDGEDVYEGYNRDHVNNEGTIESVSSADQSNLNTDLALRQELGLRNATL